MDASQASASRCNFCAEGKKTVLVRWYMTIKADIHVHAVMHTCCGRKWGVSSGRGRARVGSNVLVLSNSSQ